MVDICASLLAADYARLGEEMQRAAAAGVDSFHFDLMDGHYVPNLALAPDHLAALRPFSHLPFMAHLELDNPDKVLSTFMPLQTDMIVVQWDTLTDPSWTFDKIRAQNKKVGLGLSPDDVLDDIAHLLRDIDLLLILGVYPGFGGQSIQPGTDQRIAHARRLIDQSDRQISIAVDGGVKLENASSLAEAGADILVLGTTLFQSVDMAATTRSIRESISQSPPH